METRKDSSSEAPKRSERELGRNIVLCSDGTGNRGGKEQGTNVWRLFQAICLHDHETQPELCQQLTFYDDGVGTEEFKLLKILGGAVGLGMNANIRQLYQCLVKSYEIGDRIFLFGFSRGAFTIRSLGGFIYRCGILKPEQFPTDLELSRAVEEAFKVYKKVYKSPTEKERKDLLAAFKERFKIIEAPVHFIGVWDTVDAIGLPVDELTDALDRLFRFKFHDRRLPGTVKHAYHAVSIDDERHTFHPVMWSEGGEVREHTNVEQVWFAGVHSNVGGGYPKDEMALVTLDWMMEKAEACGLRFLADARRDVKIRQNVHGKLYDSRSGIAAYYRYMPRDIHRICNQDPCNGTRNHIERPCIHGSVFERIARTHGAYGPVYIPDEVNVVMNNSATSDEAEQAAQAFQAADPDKRRRRLAFGEVAGDFVWWRRILYYTLLAYTALFFLFSPTLAGATVESCTPGMCLLAKFVDVLDQFLPDFITARLQVFATQPLVLIGFGLGLFGLLKARSWLKGRTLAVAQAGWRVIYPLSGETPTEPEDWQNALTRTARSIRASTRTMRVVFWFKCKVMPWLVLVLAIALIYWLLR